MNAISEGILVGSIQKFSVEDGPGIRTTIFFKGCPLDCQWCHNPELINPDQQLIRSPNNCIGCGHCIEICPQKALSMDQSEGVIIDRDKCNLCLKCADECYAKGLRPVAKCMTIKEILDIAEQDKGFYDNTGGGITVSGGEVLMFGDFIIELIGNAKNRGISVCIDTSGYGNSNTLKEMSLMDNVTNILYDLKSIDNDIHKKYTGVSNSLIIHNLRMLAADEKTRNKLIMRMPLIKDVNDSKDIIEKTGKLYSELGIQNLCLLPYHSLGIGKQRNIGGKQKLFHRPSEERLEQIKSFFIALNMQVEILGR